MVSLNWYNHFSCWWPGMLKLPKITSLLFLSNNIFKKDVSNDVNFLHADKHESFLRFDRDGKAFQKFPKEQICNVFIISEKKQNKDEVDFLHTDKHQSFLQIDFNTLSIKVPY